jgi:hypothetical protein
MPQTVQLLCEDCGNKWSAGDFVQEERGVHRMFVWGTVKINHPPGLMRLWSGDKVEYIEMKSPCACDRCGKPILRGHTGVAMTTWITEPFDGAIPGSHYEPWEFRYLDETKRKQIDYGQ